MTQKSVWRRNVAFLGLAMVGALGCGADDGGVAGGQSKGGGQAGGNSSGAGGVGFEVPGSGFGDGGVLQPAPGTGQDPERVCGLETISLERVPAELLLVLDRSTSMVTDRLATGQTHWQVLTTAVETALRNTQQGVLWGLKTFPTGIGCDVRPGVDHEPAMNNQAAISATVRSATPGTRNGTPTTAAMRAAQQQLATRTSANPKYILLATDGEPTCLNGNPSSRALDRTAAVMAVADAASAGFHTFVVGIAAQRQSGEALATLNAMAEAGREARAGDNKFFSVTSEAELTDALGAIAGQVGSCSFTLSQSPPSPEDVAVRVDGNRVVRSDDEGWKYGPGQRSIELTGSFCERAKAGAFKDVKITFGCPGMVIL